MIVTLNVSEGKDLATLTITSETPLTNEALSGILLDISNNLKEVTSDPTITEETSSQT